MANLLTILRMILAILAIELIFTGNPGYCITAFFLTLIVIVLDGLDGIVARALHEESKFGSVFDIIGDRIEFRLGISGRDGEEPFPLR